MSYTTATGIFRPSKRSLVEYINSANTTTLSVDELIFGIPAPIAGTWREDNTERNTIIRITAKEISNYRESTLIMYDRLTLDQMNDLFSTFAIRAYLPETTHDLIAPIWRRYGIILDPEEIVDQPLSEALVDPEATGDPVYALTAVDGAIGWTGACVIQVTEGDAVLGDYLTQHQLYGLNYPVEGDGFQGSALVYMYGQDFTAIKEVLETYPEEIVLDEFSDDILNAIKQVDIHSGKDLWNLDPESAEWSLHGAEVIYNGINDIALPTNPSYKYVIGIQLADRVTTPPGVMYLHYNDPFDPNEI